MSNDCGIYKITNIANGMFYIGSSVSLAKRIYIHRNQLNLGKHRNSHLQRAWDKYGESNFTFDVIERVTDKNCLLDVEQRWLDETKATEVGYNICKIAANRRGVKASEETKLRMAESQRGKRHTPATRALMSKKKRGMKKPERTPEHRERLGAAHRGKIVSEETKAKLRAAWTRRKIVRVGQDYKEA